MLVGVVAVCDDDHLGDLTFLVEVVQNVALVAGLTVSVGHVTGTADGVKLSALTGSTIVVVSAGTLDALWAVEFGAVRICISGGLGLRIDHTVITRNDVTLPASLTGAISEVDCLA